MIGFLPTTSVVRVEHSVRCKYVCVRLCQVMTAALSGMGNEYRNGAGTVLFCREGNRMSDVIC